jgi:dienelactone hydrolase
VPSVLTAILFFAQAVAADPWALEANRAAPLDIQVLADEKVEGVRVREIYYTGEVFKGRPVRVYGFLACPTAADRALPGVLQLHGGGGTASKEGAVRFARSAPACALSIDWSGDPKRGKRVTDATALGDPRLFNGTTFVSEDLSDFGGRHLARALSRGLDVLALERQVDPAKLAAFGGSWGGFLSIFLAGLDGRVKCVSSGYGAGAYRGTWSYTSRHVFEQGPERAEFWLRTVDPVLRASRIGGPVALLTATNEVHFWLNSAADTFAQLPPGSRLITSPNTVHLTTVGWPQADWLNACFGAAPAWPDVRDFRFDGKVALWRAESPEKVARAELYFAPGRDNWPARPWVRVPAALSEGAYRAALPEEFAGVEGDAYPLITDALKRSVSAPPLHVSGLSLREYSARRPNPGLIDDFRNGIELWRLPVGRAPSATLVHARPDALAVTEAQGEDGVVTVETNAVNFAVAALAPGAAISFQLDTGGTAGELQVELVERSGLKNERVLSAPARISGTAGVQTIRAPLALFAGKGGPEWSAVTRLGFRCSMKAGATWKFSAVRIVK